MPAQLSDMPDEILLNIFENSNFDELSNENLPQIIPFELEIDIDGIGGIYPGNSFHSTYLPKRYQDETIFQAFSKKLPLLVDLV